MKTVEICELERGDLFDYQGSLYIVHKEMSGLDITNGKVEVILIPIRSLEPTVFNANTPVTVKN